MKLFYCSLVVSLMTMFGSVTSGFASSPVDGLESKFTIVNGIRYHYFAKGDPQKPIILFLHGFPESSITWKDQLKFFSKDYYAIAIDLKGYYLTDKPTNVADYAVPAVMKDISTFVRQLTDQPITLVGHDWGGVTAWFFGMYHPEQLSKLIIINASHSIQYFYQYYTNPAQQKAVQYVLNIQSGEWGPEYWSKDNFAAFRAPLFDDPIGKASSFFTDDVKQAYLDAWRTEGSLEATLNYYRAMQFPPKALFTSGIPIDKNPIFNSYHVRKVPTLLIWGDKDIYAVPEVNDGLEKFVENLKIVHFPEYSHWIIHENPELITKEIVDFISSPSF